MPVIRRTQPTTLKRMPSYQIASPAARLAARGLTPRQVDQAHPPVAAIRGASHTRGQRRLPRLPLR